MCVCVWPLVMSVCTRTNTTPPTHTQMKPMARNPKRVLFRYKPQSTATIMVARTSFVLVCVFTHTYTYTHTLKRTHRHTQTHTHSYLCMHVCMCIYRSKRRVAAPSITLPTASHPAGNTFSKVISLVTLYKNWTMALKFENVRECSSKRHPAANFLLLRTFLFRRGA